ncbi:hypothetical protein FANTH_4971 [Fusarium anthophilum]|uniref:FAD-binding domain-containing protein n=1 Tax=Fusarium anthophilum TaxID=48485 RepID=A0A8H5E781_9HYPO|nr:hypothetical protein FANTH_4971 [Fusarium anthophilum]
MFPGTFNHLRAVRPWNEWVVVDGLAMNDRRLVAYVPEIVGDKPLRVEVLTMDHRSVQDSVATTCHIRGLNAFILGDTGHRHPLTYGFGSNTSTHDAYNLDWEVAFVTEGLAGRSLLGTFNAERQSIGPTLVSESNTQLLANSDIWESVGLTAATPEQGET